MKARILISAPQSGQVNGSASQILATSRRHCTIRFMALSRVFGLRRARLGANAPGLVGIPTVVAHELEAFVGNVLGDRRDEVGGRERREVPPCFLFMRER